MSLNVLLWSPMGAGEHYHGPGSFAYRLYGSAPPDSVRLALAHGLKQQNTYSLFTECHRITPTPHTAFGLAAFLWRSRDWLKHHAGRFDVFHGLMGFHPTVAPALFAERLNLPAVVFVANHRVEFTDKGGIKAFFGLPRRRRNMIRQLSALIAMSRAVYDELLEIGVDPRRIARIPMGVDTARFRPTSAHERLALRERLQLCDLPTVCFVGAITRRKRPHLLVEALAHLRRKNITCQLALAGPTPEEDYALELRNCIQELDLAGLVQWCGHVQSIEDVFGASDLFALPSAFEGMPAALVEAMSCGLPSIVTNISGCQDLVTNHENGCIIEPDSTAIARAIADYLRDPALVRLHGQRCRDTVVAKYGADTVLSAHLSLFRSVMAGRDPADASTIATQA